MCGRYTLTAPADLVADTFGVDPALELAPRFNIAPTQEAAVVRQRQSDEPPQLGLLRWGLVPHWAKDPSFGARCINARSETVAEKPAFRTSFKRGLRCLVPADGFYEWKPGGKTKQPFHIRRPDGSLFAMAGLWSSWKTPDEDVLRTFTIITCPANDRLRPIHARMPVILEPRDWAVWLDPDTNGPDQLQALLVPRPDDWLTPVAVSTRVNNVRNDDAGCVTPEE